MLGFILMVILSPFIFWLLYWFYQINHYEKYLKTIPGPPRLPLLGNLLDFGNPITVLPRMLKLSQKYRGNFKIYLGALPRVLLVNSKDIEFMLSSTTHITKADNYRFIKRWLGRGLLTSGGAKWHKHRKIITPAFHFQILEEFIDIFNSSGDILISQLRPAAKKGSIDIYPFITRCALDTICETAMGTCVSAQTDINSEYVKCVNTLLTVMARRTISPILANEFLYRFSRTYQVERYALKVVHGYSRSVINKRKVEFLSRTKDNSIDSFGRKKKRVFLDSLLEYSQKDPSFTDEDIQQEVDTFMFEGHDTTASAMTFALYSLATHPDVQEKAYAELQSIFSNDPNRSSTYKDLQEMKYLEMVIKETLRLYATVPVYGRTLEEDVNLNGQILPKGISVTIFTYGVQHSPDVYEDPEVFNPERFTLENSKGRGSFSFLSFSAGPRNCIGQKFAMLEMKSLISNVLRNFQLSPAIPEHKVILKSEGVLKSANGVVIRLRERHSSL